MAAHTWRDDIQNNVYGASTILHVINYKLNIWKGDKHVDFYNDNIWIDNKNGDCIREFFKSLDIDLFILYADYIKTNLDTVSSSFLNAFNITIGAISNCNHSRKLELLLLLN